MFSRLVTAAIVLLACRGAMAADNTTAVIARGKLLYLQHCVICHQGSGQGTPGTFPPLAKSDYLMASPENGIRPIVEGLSGRITVNGTNYNNTMPPILLKDDEVAAVLTFVRRAWGNEGGAITPEQVAAVRAKSRFPTFEALKAAAAYPPLPKAPEGFAIREVTRLTENGVRLGKAPRSSSVFVLSESGNLWRVEPAGRVQQVLRGEQYLEPKRGHPGTLGFTFDRRGRLFVTANRRLETKPYVTNEVTIYRSVDAAKPYELKPHVRLSYPWGIGPFNHGVSHIAEGPDGFLYVASGSRTDGNEPGRSTTYFPGGELTNTACLWRVDPDKPSEPEVYASGLRNPYGFCWDAARSMWCTDNGPDAHMPEELNRIERGAHYGFPFQFGDSREKPYAHTPEPPANVRFTLPVRNVGPAGGATNGAVATFDPHSCPAGVVYCGDEFPESVRGSLLVTRYGNLLKLDRDVGFDVLQMRVKKSGDGFEATTRNWLSPLGRPIDILAISNRVYVLEYSRPLNNEGDVPMLPGRLLELKPLAN